MRLKKGLYFTLLLMCLLIFVGCSSSQEQLSSLGGSDVEEIVTENDIVDKSIWMEDEESDVSDEADLLEEESLSMITNNEPSNEVTSEQVSTDKSSNSVSMGNSIQLGSTITYLGKGIEVKDNIVKIVAGGEYSVKGTLSEGMLYIDTKEEVTLYLNGISITNSSGPALYIANAKNTSLVLVEGTNNLLFDGKTHNLEDTKGALFSNDSLLIKGTGALSVTGQYKHGIASDDNIIIENGTITIKAVTDGIHANDNVTINGGIINITSQSDGIDSEGDFIMNKGSLTITAGDDGIQAELDLVVNGGKIEVVQSYEGLESKAAIMINNGEINVVARDDGINAANKIVINGGKLLITSTGDAIDSNGTLTINGGYTVAIGGNNPEGGADCDNNNFTITGGTLIATGGRNSSPTSNTSTQHSVLLGGATTNATIKIEQNGNEILNFKVPKTFQNMIFTSVDLKANTTYTVYIDGNESTTFTTSSMVTNAGGTNENFGMNPGGFNPGDRRRN